MSKSDGGGPADCDILANLWRLIQSVVDDSEAELEGLGLSAKAFFLLEAVEEHPFPALLARRMHLPPPTVTYLIKQLEDRGFLGRQAEPGDLRKFRLVLTDEGQKGLRRGREALGEAFRCRLGRLALEDIRSLQRIIEQLAGNGEGRKS